MKKFISVLCVIILLMGMGISASAASKKKSPLADRDEPSTGSIPFRIYGEWGNNELYELEAAPVHENSPLKGRTIYWLGSSVTYGAASRQQSMVDYIGRMNECVCVKNAVSGTTLFTGEKEPEKSYVSRLVNPDWGFDPGAKIDAFICQISTNDAKVENLSRRGTIRAPMKAAPWRTLISPPRLTASPM